MPSASIDLFRTLDSAPWSAQRSTNDEREKSDTTHVRRRRTDLRCHRSRVGNIALTPGNGMRRRPLSEAGFIRWDRTGYFPWSCGTNTVTVFVDDSLFVSLVHVMLIV
jgi:hypothetical protein